VKPFLALVGGFVVSLGMFVFGVVFATSLLTAEPVRRPGPSVDVAGLWTEQPRTVNTASQDLERLPAAPLASGPEASDAVGAVSEASPRPGPDETVVTGALEPAPAREQQAAMAELSAAHVEWCSRRYRSYRVGDNSYTPYAGGRRPCVSPYSGDVISAVEGVPATDSVVYAEQAGDPSLPSPEWVSAGPMDDFTSEHVADCFSRYRSYRPEDNTYQPYGGGPRRQCR
jgi:hypothetical protein